MRESDEEGPKGEGGREGQSKRSESHSINQQPQIQAQITVLVSVASL